MKIAKYAFLGVILTVALGTSISPAEAAGDIRCEFVGLDKLMNGQSPLPLFKCTYYP